MRNTNVPLSVAVSSHEAFALEVQNDGLRRFLGAQLGGVDYDFGIGRRLIRIGDAGEFLYDAGASLGVQPFSIALLTNIDGRSRMHQNEAAERLDHLPHCFTSRLIRCNGRADCDAAVLRNLRGNVADAPDVNVAMLFREAKFAGQILAPQVAIQERYRTSAHLQEFRDQCIGKRRFPSSQNRGEENRDALLMPWRVTAP